MARAGEARAARLEVSPPAGITTMPGRIWPAFTPPVPSGYAAGKTVGDLRAHRDTADWGALANRIGRHIPWEFDAHYDAFLDETACDRPPFPPAEEP